MPGARERIEMTARTGSEWKDPERAEAWRSSREGLPHVPDAEVMLVDRLIRGDVRRILDLGSGDGHLIALLKGLWPAASAVGLDLSPTLIGAGRRRFADHDEVRFEVHDLMRPL